MRVSGSIVIAVTLAVAATGWILSGQFGETAATTAADQETRTAESAAARPAEPFAVRVRASTAESYVAKVKVTGQTEASRRIQIKSQTDGRVAEIGAEEGEPLAEGALVVSFALEDRLARVEQTKARLAQREIEYSAASKLAERGFQAETRKAEAFAELQTAKADLVRMQTDIAHTRITAPFAGIVEERMVEMGDVVKSGDPIAHIVDLDPILVTAQVSERDYLKLEKGRQATGRLIDGTVLTGQIRYVAPTADNETRTFRVELEIPNPSSLIVEGATAELELPLPAVMAHRISAALFTLDGEGRLGVKIATDDGLARFVPVSIVGGTADDALVAGLPDRVMLITVGQEFVADGEPIRPVPEDKVGTPEASS